MGRSSPLRQHFSGPQTRSHLRTARPWSPEGAQGLGEGMARALAAAGAKVVVADLQDDLGAKVAESLGERPRLRPPRRDRRRRLGDRDRSRRPSGSAASTSWSTTPASRSPACSIDLDPAAVRKQLEVNLLGTALGIKHAFRTMRPAARRATAAWSSTSPRSPRRSPSPASAVYSATKSGVDRLTRVAADGVRQARLRRPRQLHLSRPGPDRDGRRTGQRRRPASACSARRRRPSAPSSS